MPRIKNVPTMVAAAILGKSNQAIRCGLQSGKFPFGVAITTNPNRKPRPCYTYHISPVKFKEYTNCTDEDIFRYAKKFGCEVKVDD